MAQVVWSGSDRAILLWCAYTGAYVGALISTETEPLADAEQQQLAAEAEERKHMVDSAKVRGSRTSWLTRMLSRRNLGARISSEARKHRQEDRCMFHVASAVNRKRCIYVYMPGQHLPQTGVGKGAFHSSSTTQSCCALLTSNAHATGSGGIR